MPVNTALVGQAVGHLDWRNLARLVGPISRMSNGRWRTILISNVLINHKLTGKMAKKKTLRRSEMNTFELMPTDVTCIQ